MGDLDALTPPDRAEEMARGVPDVRLEIVAGAGHLTTLEQPDVVDQLLIDWFTR